MQWVQTAGNALTNALAVFFTMMGEEYLVILVVGVCYWCIDKNLGRKIALTLTGAMISCSLVKWILQRRRPYMDYSEIKCIRAASPDEDPMSISAQGFSCPSTHSALSAGVYGALGVNTKKTVTTVLAIVLPLLIGFSRIWLGVHYPTDVLVGWVLGAAAMLLFFAIEKKHGYKTGFLIQLAVGAIGFLYCRDNEFFSVYGVLVGLFFGFLYEEKVVHFEKSKTRLSYVLRPLLGIVIFAVISYILKLPVKNIPDGELVMLQLVYRTFRYALSTFIIIGLYPHLFKKCRVL